jgi:hypothetical protein
MGGGLGTFGSPAAFVPQGFYLSPVELDGLSLLCPLTDTLESGVDLTLVDPPGAGNQARYRLAMPGNHDFLSTLHAVEQTP